MPSDETITKAVEDIFDILSFAFGDSGLESDLNNVLWGTVNQFHHTAGRVARELDRNEQAQRSAQNEQDGSEVKSVELERLIAYGRFLSERRDALETFRDLAASAFEAYTKSPWKPPVTGFGEACKIDGSRAWCGSSCGPGHRRVCRAMGFFEAWAIYRDDPQEKN